MKIRKILKISGWILLAAILFTTLLLFLLWKTDVLQNRAEQEINQMLAGEGQIQYKSLRGNPFGHLVISDLDLKFAGQARIRVQRLELQYDFFPLLFNKIHLNKILVDQLNLELSAVSDTVKTQTVKRKPASKVNIDSLLLVFQQTHPIDSLLDKLPEIRLHDLELFAGTVRIPSKQILLKDIYTEVKGFSISKNKLFVQVNKLSGKWVQRNLQLKMLSFRLEGDRNHLSLNQFNLKTEHSRLSLSAFYNLTDRIDVNVNVYEGYIDLNDIYKVSGNRDLKQGFIHGGLTLSGQPRNFRAEVSLKGEWKHQRLDTLLLRASYLNGDVQIDDLTVESAPAQFHLQGAAYHFSGGYGVFRFAHVNLNQFDSTQVVTNLNGSLQFNVSNLVLKRATGVGELRMTDSQIDNLPIDSLRFKLKAQKGNFEIIQPSYLQVADSCRFNLEGTVSRHWAADLTLSTFDNQMGHLMAVFGLDSLRSVFDGQFRLSGKLKDPNISGDLNLPALHYQDMTFDSVRLQMYTSQIFSRRLGEALFEIKKGDIGGIPLRNLKLKAEIDSSLIHFKQAEFRSAENYVRAKLDLNFDTEKTELSIPELRILYKNYFLQNDGLLHFTMDSLEINIDNFRLQGAAGSAIEAGGFWNIKEQDLQVFLNLDHIRLKPFEMFWKDAFALSGTVNGNVELLHPLHGPEVNAEILADSLVLNAIPLGTVNMDFDYGQNALQIQKLTMQNGNTEIRAGGSLQLPLDASRAEETDLEKAAADFNMTWQQINLADYAPLLHLKQKISGLTSGRIQVSGNAAHPQIAFNTGLNDFSFDNFELDSTQVFGQYNDGYFLLDSLSGVLNRSSFALRGWMKYPLSLTHPDTNFLNKPLHLALRSRDNQISFIGLLNDQVESIQGKYDLKLEIGGTAEEPALTSGFIKMSDGQLVLSRIRDPLKEVQLDLDIDHSVLYMNQFSARSEREKDLLEQGMQWLQALIPWSNKKWKDGFLEVDGTVSTANLLKPRVELNIRMDGFYIDYFVENAALTLSTNNLTIHGQDTLRVTGDLLIPRGTFEVDLSKMSKNAYLSSASLTQSPPFTALNLGIEIPGNFVVSSSPLDLANNFKISLLGNLHVIMEPPSDAVQIAGHMETVSGKYASWNQNFDIQNGTIDFKNPKEINPEVNLLAVKKIGNRMFEVSVTGPMDDMDQNIRVTENDQELDMSYLDKIALLTLGADLGQITTQTDSTLRNVGEQVATTSVLTAVERSAEKYGGLDKVEINSSESILDLERMRLNNGLQDASISFGKYLTSDLYVEYKTQFGGDFPTPKLSWDAGNRLGLQYRINRYWSLDSYYEKTKRGNNNIQLGIKWELTF